MIFNGEDIETINIHDEYIKESKKEKTKAPVYYDSNFDDGYDDFLLTKQIKKDDKDILFRKELEARLNGVELFADMCGQNLKGVECAAFYKRIDKIWEEIWYIEITEKSIKRINKKIKTLENNINTANFISLRR